MFPDANTAGDHSKIRYDDDHVPVGAIVWWRSATHGHVGISTGHGKFIGVDLVDDQYRPGQIGVSDLTAPRRVWGQSYRGWSPDLCGHPIPGLGEHANGGHHRRHADPSAPQPAAIHLTDAQLDAIAEHVWRYQIADPAHDGTQITVRRALSRLLHRR